MKYRNVYMSASLLFASAILGAEATSLLFASTIRGAELDAKSHLQPLQVEDSFEQALVKHDEWAKQLKLSDLLKPPKADNITQIPSLIRVGRIDEATKLAERLVAMAFTGQAYRERVSVKNSHFLQNYAVETPEGENDGRAMIDRLMLNLLIAYLHGHPHFSNELNQRFKILLTHHAYLHEGTSNMEINSAVTRYLATEIWGGDVFGPDSYFKKDNRFWGDDPTGIGFIRARLDMIVHRSIPEYFSTYHHINSLPILLLADFAKDKQLRTKARFAHEIALLQAAPVWLNGHLAAASSRNYPDAATQYYGWKWFKMYFGVEPEKYGMDPVEFVPELAVSCYRLPPMIRAIARDRKSPYVAKYRFSGSWRPTLEANHYLYSYITPTYAHFSRYQGAHAQATRGGVVWCDPDTTDRHPQGDLRKTIFWVNHPHYWPPEQVKDGQDILRGHTHGHSRCQFTVQHENTELQVYDITPDNGFPNAFIYIPDGYKAIEVTENRLFLHYNGVLIAVSSSQPIDWENRLYIEDEYRLGIGWGSSQYRGTRVLIPGRQLAVAIETAPPEQFANKADSGATLLAFRKVIESKPIPQLVIENDVPVAFYAGYNGTSLKIPFDGVPVVNGIKQDFESWPTISNPWMLQEYQSGKLNFEYGEWKRFYDFSNTENWDLKR